MQKLCASLLVLSTLCCALPSLAAETPAQIIEQANGEIRKWNAEANAAPAGSAEHSKALLQLALASTKRAEALEQQERWADAEEDWGWTVTYIRRYNSANPNNKMGFANYLRSKAETQYKQRRFMQCLESLKLAADAPGWDSVAGECTLLLQRTFLHLEDYAAALTTAEAMRELINRQRGLVSKEDELASARLLAVTHYLRGNQEMALEKWQQAAQIVGTTSKTPPFDSKQAPLNGQIAANPSDASLRLTRARYFQERARFQAQAARTVATADFLDQVFARDGAVKQAANSPSPADQGGLLNLIELQEPKSDSFYEAALTDLDKGLQLLQQSKAPASVRAPFYIERAQVRLDFNDNVPPKRRYSDNSIGQDLTDAEVGVPKSSEVQRLFGELYRKRAAEIQPDSSPDWKERRSNLAKSAIGSYSKAVYFAPNDRGNEQIIALANQVMPWILDKKLENVSATQPKTALEWKERGNLYNAANDWRQAIVAYEQSLKVDPNFSDSYNNLGSVLFRIRRYDLALNMLNKAIQISPRHRMAYFNRAKVWQALSEPEKALEDASKAVGYADTPLMRQETLTLRANLYQGTKEPTKALADITTAIAIEGGDKESAVAAWTLRGDLELRAHNLDAAETSLAKATALSATQGRALLLRGLIAHLRLSLQSDALGTEAQAILDQAKPQVDNSDRSWLRRYCTELLVTPAFKDVSERIEVYYQAALK